MHEERLKEIEEKLDLLTGICQGLIDNMISHEALQGQKETAIFNHIESLKDKNIELSRDLNHMPYREHKF